jgi:protein-S-isoprenylcysteine O-methyltransferase Ste14
LLAVAALCFLAPAILAFRRAGTTVNPIQIEKASVLVTSGIYRITRNPMYVGFALLLTAGAAVVGTWQLLLGPVCFILYIQRFQIIPEERVMSRYFGDAYREYCGRVRPWL